MMRKVYLVLLMVFLITLPGAVIAGDGDRDLLPDEVHLLTEGMLTGLNENNYQKFSANFNPKMKAELTEGRFNTLVVTVKENIGDYLARQLVTVEEQGGYKIVTYAAVYTLEPQVIVRTVVTVENDKLAVAGLWLDSPKLRQ